MTSLTIPLESSAGATPWLIGGITLLIFMFLLFALLAFGKGRDHS
jgi:hypothetical protein